MLFPPLISSLLDSRLYCFLLKRHTCNTQWVTRKGSYIFMSMPSFLFQVQVCLGYYRSSKFFLLFLQVLCHFYVGEVVSSMQKATLIPGGSEGIVYATLSGAVGMLVPFSSRDAYDFFQHLELHMRSEGLSLVGREHVHYRSQHYPCRVSLNPLIWHIYTRN